MFFKKFKNSSIKEHQKRIESAEAILDDLTGFHTNLSKYKFKISSIPCSGTYANNIIQTNKNLDSIDFESTIVHELSHALQEKEIQEKESIINPFQKQVHNNFIMIGIEEAFAYFNDSFVIVKNKKHSNLYKRRIELIQELSYNCSPTTFESSFYLIKNSVLEVNKNNNKIVFLESEQHANQLSKQSYPEDILGASTALISFVSNAFSILKTSQELFKPWKIVLYELNKKLNNKKQSYKIQNNLIKLMRITCKRGLCNFIREEIEKEVN